MVKGDLRKKQILETAEALFAERGYEATGVQEILDVLHLSKGSFYHHFESKEQVLQKICENRAQAAAKRYQKEKGEDGLAWMNTLLSGMIPFQGEGLTFLKMILPVFVLPEGKSIRSGYQEALKACWLAPTEEAFRLMILQGTGFSAYPTETAGIALDLVNDLWARLGQEIIISEKSTREMVSPAKLLGLVEPYRPALENLLSAPYGSLELISLEGLAKMVEAIHNWWVVDEVNLPDTEAGDTAPHEPHEEM